MLKDNVKLEVVYQGSRDSLSKGIDEAVDGALLQRTGLMPAEVSFVGVRYKVTLFAAAAQPVARQEGESLPVSEEQTYLGTSTRNLDEAIQSAGQNFQDAAREAPGKFDEARITVEVTQIAEVPYFVLPVVVRSIDKEKLVGYHAEGVKQLAATYGNRLNQSPDAVGYMVLHTKKDYRNDTCLPREGIKKEDIKAFGVSSKSLDDAIKGAGKKPRKSKRTVYEQRSEMIVYGYPWRQEVVEKIQEVTINTREVAAPMVVAGSKSGRMFPRGAPPAGKEPVALSSLAELM